MRLVPRLLIVVRRLIAAPVLILVFFVPLLCVVSRSVRDHLFQGISELIGNSSCTGKPMLHWGSSCQPMRKRFGGQGHDRGLHCRHSIAELSLRVFGKCVQTVTLPLPNCPDGSKHALDFHGKCR